MNKLKKLKRWEGKPMTKREMVSTTAPKKIIHNECPDCRGECVPVREAVESKILSATAVLELLDGFKKQLAAKDTEITRLTAELQKIADTISKVPSITGLSPIQRFEDIPLAIRDLQECYRDAATARNFGVSHAEVSKKLAASEAKLKQLRELIDAKMDGK